MRNKFEKKIHDQLKKAKVSFDYEADKLPYVIAGSYIPDFTIRTSKGVLYIETKGYLRAADKRKLVAVKKCHPDIDLRILFYPFASLKRQLQYTKWADKNKIPWAIGKVPKEWLV